MYHILLYRSTFRGYYPKRRAWNAGCYFCIDLCHLLYYRLWSNPCCKEWGNEYRFRYLDEYNSLSPLGSIFTYKSNKDSVVFNLDVYAAFFRKLLGIRQSRHMFKKEVIIHTPEYAKDIEILDEISKDCQTYLETHRLKGMPNYIQIFTNNKHDDAIAEISKKWKRLLKSFQILKMLFC